MSGSARHYAAVLENVPHCNHGGGGITAFAAVKAMRDRGNRVTVIALTPDPKPGNDARHCADLEALGIEVTVLKGPASPSRRFGKLSLLFPSPEELFPGFLQRAEVARLLHELRPDSVFMYHWNALAAMHGFRKVPKFGTVGDPAHLPFLFRSSLLGRYEAGRTLKKRAQAFLHRFATVPTLRRLQIEMLSECQASGAYAAHHAEMFAKEGVPCAYLHTPTPDPFNGGDRPARARGKFKIMHIGHLQGIATLAGVELLANEVLPRLKKALPPNSFEIHLVGGFFETMPKELQQAMRDPYVRIRGQVTPADAEFLSADVILVPTPIELGIRVRILTAFSFGSCVVAHRSNAKGIPELKDGLNGLLAADGEGLALACQRVFERPEMESELGRGARATYLEYFSLAAAGGRLCETMDQIAGANQPISVNG